jgi:outer membrane lipoprotein-sorting protein
MMKFRQMTRPTILRRFTAAIFLTGLVLSMTGGASAQPQNGAQPQYGSGAPQKIDEVALARIQSYLNSITTLNAKFIQTTSRGGFAEGTLILARPGKMKIAYAPPTPFEIYADGTWLIYVDYELKEVNQLPLSATPAAVLLREKINFRNDIAVAALEQRDRSYRLHLKEPGEEGSGTMILAFTKTPLSLLGWVVIDAQQVRTSIVLIKPEFNATIDPRKLIFDRPDWTTIDNTE